MNRRGFLKGAAGILSLPIVGKMASSMKSPMVREGIANVANVVSDAPVYFWKLVDKIRNLGKDVTETGALSERQNVKSYKDYTLTEDTATGRIEIQKVKVADDIDYYGSPLSEEVYMGYSPGETILGKNGKPIKTLPDYEEGTSYLRNDGPNTGDVLDEMSGITDDIFLEVGEAVPEAIRKGKADGGIISLADGGRVELARGGIPRALQAALKAIKSKFGDDAIMNANSSKRKLTKDEIEDFTEELGDTEYWMSEGTLGEAEQALKNKSEYEASMFREYKKGNLDPVAGDKSPARKRFLEKKLEDMEMSGDSRLMTRDEIEELSSFDLGTEMDNFVSAEQKLRKEFPGLDEKLIKQILTDDNPQRIAEVKQTMREALEMKNKGMSIDEIVEIIKGTTRTKQANGGIIGLTSNPRSASNKAGVETLFKRR